MLYIDPRLLSPAPKEIQGISCSACDRSAKSGAKWHFYPGGNKQAAILFCSPCFLEGWAKTQSEYTAYLQKVEARMGRSLNWENENRLTVSDADRVLSAIVVTSRLKYSKCPPA